MTDNTPPPGAIIPARIGKIGLDLPEGWWLMRGEDAKNLGAGWESVSVGRYSHDPKGWVSCLDGWGDDVIVIVRRRTVQVTVDARPGDRVVVLSPQAMDGMRDFGYGARRTTRTDAFQAAIDDAVVAE